MLAHENDGDTKAVVGDLSRERAQRARRGVPVLRVGCGEAADQPV